MALSPELFADLLTEAIYKIKAQSGKNIAIIQDELGYTLKREGGSFIAFLRKGNVPAELQDTEQLAFELIQRGGLERNSCTRLLLSAGHPEMEALIETWFGPDAVPRRARPSIDQLAPFVVGPPIKHPRQFFGRTQELTRIFNLWQAQPLQHIAVIGERRSGKTSLLHHIMQITTATPMELRKDQRTDWLPNPQQMRWIFVDFQNPHMRQQAGLLRHLAKGMELHITEPSMLESFIHTIMEHPLAHPTIVVMDELGAGMNAPELTIEFWWGMRALLNALNSENLAFLVASHQPPAELAEEQGQTSPFFNMFNMLQLGPLTEAEAQSLIASSPIRIPTEDIAWILQQSARMPYRLQILCQERLLALQTNDTSADWQDRAVQRLL